MEPPRCPITQDFMRDPVMAADGQTYERAAITEWFRQHSTSPYTGLELTSKELTTNWAIKQMMEAYNNPPPTSSVSGGAAAVAASSATLPKPTPSQAINVSQSTFTYKGMRYHRVELIYGSKDTLPATRKPVCIILVIDVSGSMSERATPFNPSGENDDFSRLDLVKHSIATIQKSLQPGDNIALVAFSSNAYIALDTTEVSANESLITTRINALMPGGTTNIWSGLKIGIDLANRQDNTRFNTSVMLLTDGVDSGTLPRGVLPTFETYFKPMLGKFSIHTFAYGYEVDSALVSQIAAKSQGVFGYIPDATMVGTVFINTMSAILSTVYNDVALEVKFLGTPTSHTEKINLGSILYGQPRTILIPYNASTGAPESLNLSYNNGMHSIVQCRYAPNIVAPLSDNCLMSAIAKDALTNLLHSYSQLTYYSADIISRLEDFIALFVSYSSDSNPFIRDVIIDCCDADPNKGQIGKSIAKLEWFNKWGQHYLKSIASAYRQEWCLNFKDLAPQHFTSATFASFREKIETIFLSIAPPVPSHRTAPAPSAAAYRQISIAPVYSAPVYSAPSSMRSFYDRRGGCFTGNWNIMLANGISKSVKDIMPGDCVISNDSPTGSATITHIVRLRVNEQFEMCSPDGIVGITSYHPFWMTNFTLNRVWQFPIQELKNSITIKAGEYIYDFIIDHGFSVSLEGGYNVACLGHGCQDSDVITHDYFGTQRVINDLKDHKDFSTGFITLNEWRFVRNASGLVCKLEW